MGNMISKRCPGANVVLHHCCSTTTSLHAALFLHPSATLLHVFLSVSDLRSTWGQFGRPPAARFKHLLINPYFWVRIINMSNLAPVLHRASCPCPQPSVGGAPTDRLVLSLSLSYPISSHTYPHLYCQ